MIHNKWSPLATGEAVAPNFADLTLWNKGNPNESASGSADV